MPRDRALLLSGGAALGANQVYPLERLAERHGLASYRDVCCVSVGALNGIGFAMGKLDAVREVWRSMTSQRTFMRHRGVRSLIDGLYSLEPTRGLVSPYVRLADIADGVTFYCGVSDFETDTYELLPHTHFLDDDELVDGILASSAQPAIMAGYELRMPSGERHLCFDGGVHHVIPNPHNLAGIEHIDVVLASPTGRRNRKARSELNSLFEIGSRALATYNDGVILHDLHLLADLHNSGRVEVTVYAPEQLGDPFEASPEVIARRLDEVGRWAWENPKTPDQLYGPLHHLTHPEMPRGD